MVAGYFLRSFHVSAHDVAPSQLQSSKMSRRVIWLLLAAVTVGVMLFFMLRGKAPASGGPNPWAGPVAVKVERALVEDFTVQVQVIGTVTPYNTVTVRSRVEGQLARVLVREGQHVERGQLLAEIDARPYRVQLAQAQGQDDMSNGWFAVKGQGDLRMRK